MKNSKFTLFFYCTILLFVASCGDDNPTTTNPPTPTFQDSVIKLYSPANNSHFVIGDTIRFSWSRGYASSFTLYVTPDSNNGWGFGQTFYDTTNSFVLTAPSSDTLYWKIQPNYTVSNPERFKSPTWRYYRN